MAALQPSSVKQHTAATFLGKQQSRRAIVFSGAILPVLALSQPAGANYVDGELEAFDYLSPTRFAVKKQRQKQQKCYDAGECADTQPYYAIECERNDIECLQRKRRMANQEFQDFFVDPTSSPLLLLASGAFAFQWGSALLRIGSGLLSRAAGESESDEDD